MKKINYIYISAFAAAISLSACNKALNIKPKEQIDQTNAIVTSNDVQSTLVGAYNRMAQTGVYGGRIFVQPDLMAATDTVLTFNGTYQGLTQITNQAIPNDNSFVLDTWQQAYQAINLANNVVANLSKADAGQRDRMEGEAKFIRGLIYFDLARLYGRAWNDGDPATNLAVPIVLTPTTGVDNSIFVPRNTVKEVYTQAINDLKTAEAKLPATNSFYANSGAASAILARLYLQQGDYTNAGAEANTVIASGTFTLNAKYSDEFPIPGKASHVDNTPEDIFAIQVTEQQGITSMNEFYASASNSGRGDIHIDPAFIAEFDANDTRGQFYTPKLNSDNSVSFYRTKKFDNTFGNVHVVRLAEMYLIRAESNLQTGKALGATPLSDINKIRERAGANDLTAVALSDIKAERRHELAFEGGFFLHDAKRLGLPVGKLQYSSPKLVFPIPLREIQANSKLVQNPGY
ncbi:RagB/SusD family nutrient uptake outer membrane protein [Mucilaginibacter lappiensis]|uniref:Tetratricopeptide (TPR) repeat protein n=1 Tax=Mucilaginibacter lappiensis TaxID=354630 RepID=A0A841JGZ1_9SPHI|nr:RagB/SusD family nutrient uptake outer membrane protein [Mucilaginibacter lappiensis]MBB6130207.1 tetratricopeptide (TPR) repeat protein [Mucilaginibacter lappiensis]